MIVFGELEVTITSVILVKINGRDLNVIKMTSPKNFLTSQREIEKEIEELFNQRNKTKSVGLRSEINTQIERKRIQKNQLLADKKMVAEEIDNLIKIHPEKASKENEAIIFNLKLLKQSLGITNEGGKR